MRGDGMPGPNGTDFACGIVTDREYKIHHRRVRARKLVPALGTIAIGRDAGALERLQGERIDRALWKTSCRVGAKSSLAFEVQEAFGEDRARRISRAEEQDVVDFFHHQPLPPQQTSAATAFGAVTSAGQHAVVVATLVFVSAAPTP